MQGFQSLARRASSKSPASGMVRGPGTGTSDDVADVVPPGTYIMPADSTRAVGPQQLAADGARGFKPGGRGGVPVQLSAGEYKLSPDQVHAIGARVLDQVKDATHQPARGFVSGRFPVQRLEDQDSGERQFFADGGLVEEKRPNSFGDAAAAAKDPSVTIPAGFAPATNSPGLEDAQRRSKQALEPEMAPTQPGGEIMPGVYTHGRGQYSDNPAGMGFKPGFTGQPNAQNMAAADTLAVQSQQDARARIAAQAQAAAPQAASVQAPIVHSSLNDWQIRNNLRNARISAGSSMSDLWNKRFGSKAQRNAMSPEMAEYLSLLKADEAAINGQSAMDSAAMRENAGLQREGMQQAGANQRSADRLASDSQRLGLDTLAKGFDIRNAQRREGILQRYDAAKTDEERAALAKQFPDVFGKDKGAGAPAGYRWGADGASLEAIPGGPADSTSGAKPLSESQNKSLQFGVRMQSSVQNMDRLAAAGVDQPGLIKRAADTVGLGTLANWTQSPQQQQVEQAQRDFVNAVLRRESGAAISASEFDNARKQYFPQIGDSPEVAEQKRQNRELATRGMLAEVPNQERRVASVAGQQRTVSRSGTMNGRRVVQYSDGSIEYAN